MFLTLYNLNSIELIGGTQLDATTLVSKERVPKGVHLPLFAVVPFEKDEMEGWDKVLDTLPTVKDKSFISEVIHVNTTKMGDYTHVSVYLPFPSSGIAQAAQCLLHYRLSKDFSAEDNVGSFVNLTGFTVYVGITMKEYSKQFVKRFNTICTSVVESLLSQMGQDVY